MSKRQLTWFVEQGKVDGWSDPRFPTVRGILRHGETVAGLREFILGMGASKSAVQMEWDKFWATNKKIIDPAAARYTALEAGEAITLTLTNVKTSEKVDVPLHPKNPDVGTKKVPPIPAFHFHCPVPETSTPSPQPHAVSSWAAGCMLFRS